MHLPQIMLSLTGEPLQAKPPRFPEDGSVGSIVEFYGIVRVLENEQSIPGLTYEAYEEMARHQFERVIAELQSRHPVQAVEVIHRVGFVPVGQPAIFLRVKSAHRAEGLAFATEFLNRMKQDVPIWKTVLADRQSSGGDAQLIP